MVLECIISVHFALIIQVLADLKNVYFCTSMNLVIHLLKKALIQ